MQKQSKGGISHYQLHKRQTAEWARTLAAFKMEEQAPPQNEEFDANAALKASGCEKFEDVKNLR